MIVKAKDFLSFLKRCQQESLGGFKQVIVPRKSLIEDDSNTYFSLINEQCSIDLDTYRAADPLKSLYYYARETILPADEGAKRMIVGAKGCDLRALRILDKALINEDFVDPVYQSWRENTTIIASDCTTISPSCHCNLVEGKPYATNGFDMNLAPAADSYLITVGSKKGEELLKLMKEYLTLDQLKGDEKEKIKTRRRQTEELLREQNSAYQRSNEYANLRKADLEKWIDESKDCIGCGGCTNICPTCYCIIINDESQGRQFVKIRTTDSCQLHGYARVAGGDTPRPKMYNRFRNRYLCKFDYMRSNFDEIGCTGCGRCIDVCAGEIEFREVVTHKLQPTNIQE